MKPRGGAARQGFELAGDGLLHRVGERRIVGDQDRLRRRVVLGLGQEVGGDPLRIGGVVGEDQHFGRAGDHVDADLAKHVALGRRHIGVAGADDLVDRGNRLRPVGQCRDRLGTADAIDLIDTGERGGGEHQRVELAVRRRHHHHQAAHTGHLGGHGVHQHRGRIGRRAAGHIEPDRGNRGPAVAKLDADCIDEALVLRQLPAVVGFDARMREPQRRERLGVALRRRGLDLGGADAQRRRRKRRTVKLVGELDQCRIAARSHVRDDRPHRGLDVLRRFALGAEKRRKARAELGAACIKPDRHGESWSAWNAVMARDRAASNRASS